MGKDPAFLFYPGDWMGGTITFSRVHKGAYMDLLMAQFNCGHLSIEDVMHILGTDFSTMWESKLKSKFETDINGCFFNKKLEIEQEKRKAFTQSRRDARTKADEDDVRIYLLKDLDSGLIKIGSSVNPMRRYNEIANQTISVVGSSDARNYKLIWFSCATVRIREKELHDIFNSKRVSGEWFELSNDDIDTIKRTFSRTSDRTENENENINTNKVVVTPKKEGVQRKKTSFPENFAITSEMIDWAKAQGVAGEEIEPITDHFRDDRISKGEKYIDWSLAWKTWIRNHIKFSKGGQNGKNKPRKSFYETVMELKPEDFASEPEGS